MHVIIFIFRDSIVDNKMNAFPITISHKHKCSDESDILYIKGCSKKYSRSNKFKFYC